MFSTAQQSYIEALLPTYAKEGYKYYVAYTNTVANSGYGSTAVPDLYVVFSKKTISAKDAYSYVISDDSILVTVRSGNYSNSSYSVNTDRVVVNSYPAQTLEVNVYEHIYTNATFTGHILQPDIYLSSGGESIVQTETLSFIIVVTLLFVALRKLWFGKR